MKTFYVCIIIELYININRNKEVIIIIYINNYNNNILILNNNVYKKTALFQ